MLAGEQMRSKRTSRVVGLLIGILVMCAVPYRARTVQQKGVPKFEVDPSWPKSKPSNWVWGEADVLGINADPRDHVWVTTRGQIAEFDPAGNLLQVWSARGEGNKWTTIHGLFLDHNNFIWTTGREQ